jgi:glycosyltransferase involved in cell wall biosynthesis
MLKIIDIIICTYNRPNESKYLINQLFDLNTLPNRIIVVDSSDVENLYLKNLLSITYIKTSHKNQPYQRYLGFQHSNAEFILYLDDDMEVINKDIISDLNSLLIDCKISGIAINFTDKFKNNSLSKIPNSFTNKLPSFFSSVIRYLTFNSKPGVGLLGLFGERGLQPKEIKKTEIISGGAFLARREFLFKNFNYQLFELFQYKLGMGEDTILGYGLSKLGTVLYFPKLSFYHNDHGNSNYSSNLKLFSNKVLYSRLYIALEKTRLDNNNLLITKFKYIIYGFSRLLGLIINFILKPSFEKNEILRGSFKGYLNSFSFKFKFKTSINLFSN